MSKQTHSKRKYDSTRRKTQARETQRQIVAAARALFIQYGFAGTTIEAIAQQANVAVETIYATFGSKRNILSRVVDFSVTGDDEPVPLLERDSIKAVEAELDQRQQIGMFANRIADIMSRVAPLFQVMRTVSKTEPEIAQILEEFLNGRLQGMEQFIHALAQHGPLRNEFDERTIIETVWALTSAEVYNLMTLDRGWSGEQYENWLAGMLTQLLLAQDFNK
jgi:TetR/AcrR family transcriptional regulator of autoinduction and epiphytic fitness